MLTKTKNLTKDDTTIPVPVFTSIETSAYSGATLLSFLLGTHPDIATVGEMDGLIASEDPELYLCSCGTRIRDCQFWQSVTASMHEKGFEFDVAHFNMSFIFGGPSFLRYLRMGSSRNNRLDAIRDAIFHAWPGERQRLKALTARNEAFVRTVLAVTGKSVFVDSSKQRLRVKSLHKFSNLDVRMIHLVRDVRGVVVSRLRRGSNIDAREAARQWTRLHQRLQIIRQTLPEGKYIRIRYEDLCRDPQGTLSQLYHFCDVDSEIKVSDFRAAPHHIVGNPMRLTNITEIKLDERWRNFLTGEQFKEIDGVAGELMHQYGYQS